MTQPRPEAPYGARSLEAYRQEVELCVKCGSCSSVCPSYQVERNESYSARGRMALVKAVLDGRLAMSRTFQDRMATCTGCLACESACPSGVRVTAIIQAAREVARDELGSGVLLRAIAALLKRPALFRPAAKAAPLVLHLSLAKQAGSPTGRNPMPVHDTPGARGRVLFFPGCAVAHFQPDIRQAASTVLGAVGYEVIEAKDLVCCGRPLLSLGDRKAAQELAARNAAVFKRLKADALVTACASCGLTFKKDYPALLRPGAEMPRVLDIHEFLSGRVLEGLKPGPVRERVTVHEGCHLGRGQGLSRAVRGLLQTLPGVSVFEMKDAGACCGFGGVMRVTHRRLSDEIADRKVRDILDTGAGTVVTGCPGCRMQLTGALHRRQAGIEVVHTLQLMERLFRGHR